MNIWDDSIGKTLSRPEVAGVAGAMMGAAVGVIPGATRIARTINAVAGILIAFYVGPWTTDMLNVQSEHSKTAIGFLVGMFGLAVMMQVATALKLIDWKKRIEALLDFLPWSK